MMDNSKGGFAFLTSTNTNTNASRSIYWYRECSRLQRLGDDENKGLIQVPEFFETGSKK
jgi:hypothetical protein